MTEPDDVNSRGVPDRERLTDVCDIASSLEMSFTSNAIRQAREKVRRQQEPNSGGVYATLDCVECGGDIGIGRLNAAAANLICIFCATKAERKR